MKDRQENQFERVQLPPTWCSGICRNAMNEVCVEHCAPKRDCSGFEEKPNLKLADMPSFPKTDGMTKEEKFTSVTIYLSKVVDHLQGVDDEVRSLPVYRASRTKSIDMGKATVELAAVLEESLQMPTTAVEKTEKEKE